MDQSYHDQLAAGVEKRFRDLEMSIMDDIIRRIRKAGTITDSADWQIQRLIILGNSTQDIEDLIRKAVDGNEEEVRRLYAEVIEREYTRDRSLYDQIRKAAAANNVLGDVDDQIRGSTGRICTGISSGQAPSINTELAGRISQALLEGGADDGV